MLAGAGLYLATTAAQPDPSRKGRAAALLLTTAEPLTFDVQASMDASDALVARLREGGETDVREAIARRLAEGTVSDAEALSFFEANRHLFAERTFAQARPSVDRLIRIHRVRIDLDIPAPDRGIRWR